MRFTRYRSAVVSMAPLIAAGLLALALLAAPQTGSPAQAGSCFSVAGNVVCMDQSDVIAVPPIMPPLIEPVISDGIGGSDDSIVIEDNGGYERDQG